MAGVFIARSASSAARPLLSGLEPASILAFTFLYPASSSTARTAPPAVMPEPASAGRIITLHDPLPCTVSLCGTLSTAVMGTSESVFLASVTAFWTATTTSFAFATPTPTTPLRLPITTTARKDSCLPPLTTFTTRDTWGLRERGAAQPRVTPPNTRRRAAPRLHHALLVLGLLARLAAGRPAARGGAGRALALPPLRLVPLLLLLGRAVHRRGAGGHRPRPGRRHSGGAAQRRHLRRRPRAAAQRQTAQPCGQRHFHEAAIRV